MHVLTDFWPCKTRVVCHRSSHKECNKEQKKNYPHQFQAVPVDGEKSNRSSHLPKLGVSCTTAKSIGLWKPRTLLVQTQKKKTKQNPQKTKNQKTNIPTQNTVTSSPIFQQLSTYSLCRQRRHFGVKIQGVSQLLTQSNSVSNLSSPDGWGRIHQLHLCCQVRP